MDAGISDCLSHLASSLRRTRYQVKNIIPCENYYHSINEDGEDDIYMKEVAEIILQNDVVIYADIGGDSNYAAIKDVLEVIEGKKKQSSKIESLVRRYDL